MTPQAQNEDYWRTLADGEGTDDEDETETVLDRIVDQLDPERIHGIEFHGSNGQTYYGVVAYSGTQNGLPVLDLRTVVVDLEQQVVKIHNNGLWIPRSSENAEALVKLLARSTSDLAGSSSRDAPPATISSIGADPESILTQEIEGDEYEAPDDGWGETWGNGQGEPPEAHALVRRLEEAGVETERFSRLNFGEKTPWERYANRPVDELLGNYGVETLEGDPLVVVDVDYPEDAPIDALPETYRVSSPNGSDERAHHYYVVEDSDRVAEHFGTAAVKPGWGDVWVSGEYVVGPGCRADDGRYEVVSDVPITEIAADDLIDLLEDSWTREEQTIEPEPEDDDRVAQADDEGAAEVVCHDCGREIEGDEATLTDRDGSPVYVCGGECRGA